MEGAARAGPQASHVPNSGASLLRVLYLRVPGCCECVVFSSYYFIFSVFYYLFLFLHSVLAFCIFVFCIFVFCIVVFIATLVVCCECAERCCARLCLCVHFIVRHKTYICRTSSHPDNMHKRTRQCSKC